MWNTVLNMGIKLPGLPNIPYLPEIIQTDTPAVIVNIFLPIIFKICFG